MLILLRCPLCKKNLEGANNSKVFFCTNCLLGFDFTDPNPKSYPFFYIEPKIKRESLQVFFPFWRILSEFRVSPVGENHLPGKKKFFYIPAFFIKNIGSFEDIGYLMTFKNDMLKPAEKRNLAIFPADRGLNDCLAYPLIYLYQAEARSKNGRKPADIFIDHKDISLVMIPFYKINGEYQDSILSWKCPSGALL